MESKEEVRAWPSISLSTFLANPPLRLDEILQPDLLYPGGRLMLYGAAKAGKSFLGVQLGLCLARGIPWLGYAVTRSWRVIYLQGEISEWGLYKRLNKAVSAEVRSANIPFIICTATHQAIKEMEDVEELAALVREAEAEVLIIDPLYHFMVGSEISGQDTSDYLRLLASLQAVTGVAIILLHHSRKSLVSSGVSVDTGFGEAKGSTTFVQWPDTIARLQKVNKDVRELRWEGVRHGVEPPDKTLFFNGETCQFEELEHNPAEVVMSALADGPIEGDELKKLVREETGLGARQVDRVIARLVEKGVLERRRGTDKRKGVFVLVSWKEER